MLPGARERTLARRRLADLLEGAAVAVVVVTVMIFLLDGGGQSLVSGTAADRLVGLGRITGLVGTALLLLQLLLSARLPWVDRTYGHDRALVAHRRLSRVALPLLLAHAGRDHAGVRGPGPPVAAARLARRTGAAARGRGAGHAHRVPGDGTAGRGRLTSVQAARRRTRHETWHLVHLTGYLAVVLSVPHQLSTGTDIAGHPLARAWWLALYVGDGRRGRWCSGC